MKIQRCRFCNCSLSFQNYLLLKYPLLIVYFPVSQWGENASPGNFGPQSVSTAGDFLRASFRSLRADSPNCETLTEPAFASKSTLALTDATHLLSIKTFSPRFFLIILKSKRNEDTYNISTRSVLQYFIPIFNALKRF